MSIDIITPTLGESVAEATIGKWYKTAGDAVTKDELIVELETDKVTLEVNAPESGAMTEIIAQEGDEVEVGALLAKMEAGAAGAAPSAQSTPAAATPAAPAPVAAPAAAPADGSGPAARKMMAENGISSGDVNGSGKGGRVTKGDVISALNNPVAASASAGPREDRVKMTKLRKAIARRLKESQNTAAMLTTFNEVDMTNVMALRSEYKDLFLKEHDAKLGFMSFFTKAVVAALKELPAVNAEIDGDELVYKNYYDIGMAVGTPQGLVVPVIRDCDQLSMAGIESSLVAVAKKARDGKLSMADMSGGTFTITNGGVYGSMLSTPIINPPQSGILGLHNIVKRATVMPDGSIQARPIMYLALSYDHRIVDGREAVTFLVRVKQMIEDPRRLLLGL
jgi:2-oxoglutarate dehydrogenase E2 component (dihydrolipoamide succinyltransferase)